MIHIYHILTRMSLCLKFTIFVNLHGKLFNFYENNITSSVNQVGTVSFLFENGCIQGYSLPPYLFLL